MAIATCARSNLSCKHGRQRTTRPLWLVGIDPKNAGKDEPGFWARLLGASSNPQAAIRYRIAVKGSGDKTLVAVLTSAQKVRAWASPIVMPVPFGAN